MVSWVMIVGSLDSMRLEAYLEPGLTSTMELLCKNILRLKAYFHKKALS